MSTFGKMSENAARAPQTPPRLTSPLAWPMGWPRTPDSERHTATSADLIVEKDRLIAELKRFGASDLVLSTNLNADDRGNFLTSALNTRVKDAGIAVRFHLDAEAYVFAFDAFESVADNFKGLTGVIQSLVRLEKTGAGAMVRKFLEACRAGTSIASIETNDKHAAKPSTTADMGDAPALDVEVVHLDPVASGGRSWWDVLGVSKNALPADITSAYQQLRTRAAASGDSRRLYELDDAYQRSRQH